MKYDRNAFARFVPILLVVLITIVAIAAVIAVGRSLMGGQGSSNTPEPDQTEVGRTALLSTDVSRSVQLTVRGPIVASESHRSYRITIGPDSREMVTYEGYLGKVLDRKTFDNNSRAYSELVHALDKRRMMDGRELKEEQSDLRGICASKKLYQFETLANGETVVELWTTDCDGSKGSALANVDEILDMFLKQIPEGRKMASSVGLAQQESFFRL